MRNSFTIIAVILSISACSDSDFDTASFSSVKSSGNGGANKSAENPDDLRDGELFENSDSIQIDGGTATTTGKTETTARIDSSQDANGISVTTGGGAAGNDDDLDSGGSSAEEHPAYDDGGTPFEPSCELVSQYFPLNLSGANAIERWNLAIVDVASLPQHWVRIVVAADGAPGHPSRVRIGGTDPAIFSNPVDNTYGNADDSYVLVGSFVNPATGKSPAWAAVGFPGPVRGVSDWEITPLAGDITIKSITHVSMTPSPNYRVDSCRSK